MNPRGDVYKRQNTTKEKATYMDLTMLESCKALDDTTVEFKLSEPCVTFIYTVAPVSYTHLDVYKRQEKDLPLSVFYLLWYWLWYLLFPVFI